MNKLISLSIASLMMFTPIAHAAEMLENLVFDRGVQMEARKQYGALAVKCAEHVYYDSFRKGYGLDLTYEYTEPGILITNPGKELTVVCAKEIFIYFIDGQPQGVPYEVMF